MSAPLLFTIGHSTRALDDLLALLRAHSVRCLADVRRWPRSRRHPHFTADALAPALAFAYLGAAAFGLFTSATLVGGMSLLQSRLAGEALVAAFAVFHVLIRAGLSLAALGAGVAVDLAGAVRLPLLGRLGPARLVLLAAGLLVVASAVTVRLVPEEVER